MYTNSNDDDNKSIEEMLEDLFPDKFKNEGEENEAIKTNVFKDIIEVNEFKEINKPVVKPKADRTFKLNIDYDEYINTENGTNGKYTLKVNRNLYNSDYFVTLDEEAKQQVKEVVANFETKMYNFNRETTPAQIDFIKQVSDVFFGKLKKAGKVTLVPASCGTGKSVGKLTILEYVQKQMMLNNWDKGGVLVTADELKDLKKLEQQLLESSGGRRYCYLIEGWNKDICLDKTITELKAGMCVNCKHKECKIFKQFEESKNFPILLMTNARINTMNEGVEKYIEWKGGFRSNLIIDECPNMFNDIKVNVALLNKIETYINNVQEYELKDKKYDDIIFLDEEKTELVTLYKQLSDAIIDIMNKNRNKKEVKETRRKYISICNNEDLTSDDERFHELWYKYKLNFVFDKELKTMEMILRKGGLYVNEGSVEYIAFPIPKDLEAVYSLFNKVMVLDGSSLFDMNYKLMENYSDYLNVQNLRTYENLTIVVHENYNLSKTSFNDAKCKHNEKLIKGCSRFLNNLDDSKLWYVVTHKDCCDKIVINEENKDKFILDTMMKDKEVTIDEIETKALLPVDALYHFGATKGKNITKDGTMATNMVQLGYSIPKDEDTVLRWLATVNIANELYKTEMTTARDIIGRGAKKTSRNIATLEIIDSKERNYITNNPHHPLHDLLHYRFGISLLNEYEWTQIAVDVYQEINRLAIRQQDNEEHCEVHLFKINRVVIEILRQLFPHCSIIYTKDKLEDFELEKKLNRKSTKKTGDGTTAYTRMKKYLNSLSAGTIVKVEDILKGANVTKDEFKNTKKRYKDIRRWLDEHKTDKKGYYKA